MDADAEANRELAQRFGIRGYPTLKLFRNGVATDYQGQRSAAEIVSFMRKYEY
jgi:protein disulfide-isomerase A1